MLMWRSVNSTLTVIVYDFRVENDRPLSFSAPPKRARWPERGVGPVGCPSVRSIAKRMPNHTASRCEKIERPLNISPMGLSSMMTTCGTCTAAIRSDVRGRRCGNATDAVGRCVRTTRRSRTTIAPRATTAAPPPTAYATAAACTAAPCRAVRRIGGGAWRSRRRCWRDPQPTHRRSPKCAPVRRASNGKHSPRWVFPVIGKGWIITTNNGEGTPCHKCLGHTCL